MVKTEKFREIQDARIKLKLLHQKVKDQGNQLIGVKATGGGYEPTSHDPTPTGDEKEEPMEVDYEEDLPFCFPPAEDPYIIVLTTEAVASRMKEAEHTCDRGMPPPTAPPEDCVIDMEDDDDHMYTKVGFLMEENDTLSSSQSTTRSEKKKEFQRSRKFRA